jgi:YD repeat-containing protein
MKFLIGTLSLILLTGATDAQYYYKDIVSTRQNIAKWQALKSAGVRSVKLNSSEGDGRPTDGFSVDQTVNADLSGMTTHSKTNGTTETWTFTTYSPQGLLTSVIDTSNTYQSVSIYRYDNNGRLSSISDTSTELDNHVRAIETHLWQYASPTGDIPTGMLKIENGTDTTYVRFTPDEKGNIGEEQATRNKEALPAVYYYYDDQHRLTDIVRYSPRARRLLPDNIFEYDDNGRPTSMLVVQEGAASYQKWIYTYNDKGLREKESCFSKQRELLGEIRYQYSFK